MAGTRVETLTYEATRVTWPSHRKIQPPNRQNTTGTRTTQRQRPSPPEPYPLESTNQRNCDLIQVIPAKANVTTPKPPTNGELQSERSEISSAVSLHHNLSHLSSHQRSVKKPETPIIPKSRMIPLRNPRTTGVRAGYTAVRRSPCTGVIAGYTVSRKTPCTRVTS